MAFRLAVCALVFLGCQEAAPIEALEGASLGIRTDPELPEVLRQGDDRVLRIEAGQSVQLISVIRLADGAEIDVTGASELYFLSLAPQALQVQQSGVLHAVLSEDQPFAPGAVYVQYGRDVEREVHRTLAFEIVRGEGSSQ